MGLFGEALFGKPSNDYQVSKLTPEQQKLEKIRIAAATAQGAGGAQGQAADYWRSNLSDNPADMEAFAAPEQRRFNEQTIPDLAEQFAGMGSGGLSSSGFRNAAVGAGADLSERLGAIRAQLRERSAQSLYGAGEAALQPTVENIHENPTEGAFGQLAGLGVQAGLAYAGAPKTGGAPGSGAGATPGGKGFGTSSPYGNSPSGRAYRF